MRKYFGTDGIRRIANTELSPELVYRVAKAGAYTVDKDSASVTIPADMYVTDISVKGNSVKA